MQTAARLRADGVDEAPEFLLLDFDRLSPRQQVQWEALEHYEVVQLAGLAVSVWLDRVRGVVTVWGPGVRDWYAAASHDGDLDDAVLPEGLA